MSFVSDFGALKDIINNIATNAKVSRFSYNSNAYNNNNYSGVSTFSVGNDNNIPTSDSDIMGVNTSIVDYGFRSQASTISRMLMNHFFGRISYNLNKIYDVLNAFMQLLYTSRGQANGFASLDQNGRVPVNQLPLDTLVYVGEWDASTNTPTLADGTGTKGDFYIVTEEGTQTFGGKTVHFFENDRIVYSGSVWQRLSGGDVKTVNDQQPVNGNVKITGSDIEVSSDDSDTIEEALDTLFPKAGFSFNPNTGVLTITN